MSPEAAPSPGTSAPHEVVFTEEQIRSRVGALAAEISDAFGPEDRLLLVGLLKGSFLFLADLARNLTVPVHVDFMIASSYGAGRESSGEVRIRHDLETDVSGRAVLLVEDIVDSGATLETIVPLLRKRGARRVDVCTLLHKRLPGADVEVRWVGFDAPNSFLVGYGLDLAEDFRHLPYIASV